MVFYAVVVVLYVCAHSSRECECDELPIVRILNISWGYPFSISTGKMIIDHGVWGMKF